MSFLQNASIRTKILSLILPLCIVGLGATAYMATRYKEADNAYSDFIAGDNAALVELARANRNLMAMMPIRSWHTTRMLRKSASPSSPI